MSEYIDRIKEISERLLADGKVDMVIGFRKGTLPMMSEPCFVRSPAEVASLVWDSHCGINLTNYLTDRKENIAVIAKGCDARNIVTHIIENKIKREQLTIIGVPCKGMADKHKISEQFSGEIEAISEDADTLIVTGGDTEKRFLKVDMLQENCRVCIHRNPVVYDELVGEPVEEQTGVDRYQDIHKIESMSPAEKSAFFKELLSGCIRCYACRNACPLCYCPTCFVDESRPQWVGKSQDPTDIETFHFLRAYHCAGRCTDCGACERACPMGIKMRLLTKKLEKDCLDLFDWEAGLNLDARPPLDVYRPDDPDDFIK